MDMRRTSGRLAATTGVALALAVLVATPADARRNVGGTMPAGAICVSPGQTQARSDRAGEVLDCFCWFVPPAGERNVGGNVPNVETNCPPGILKQYGLLPR
jgi:hypothetical protein